VARECGPDGQELLTAVRAALAQDLDTPAALALVDDWATATGGDASAPDLVRELVDALLGVSL
jgi:L-cysteine:1D-myo-inositol 2-amino-2-deoxy-alpha-D-glucopyranoside ligase